uniref:Amidase domain-containing protein n=1 Tax=Chelydra serpentina TaxID=8475 RepID=A0A8C3SAW0_CHESE
MIQADLWPFLPESEVDLRGVVALLCGSAAAAVLVLRWVGQRRIQEKMEQARRTRDLSLERMEKVARRFKQQNPGIQAGHILSLPLVELAEKLKEGSLSPESVLYTYIDQALEVTREVNCVTDFMQSCEEQLREVQRQKERGLLYGVPVTLFPTPPKGHVSTGGLVQFLGRVEEEDSVIVQVLKRQGAIPFVKTNVPQSMINYDCSNLIFGQTVNPLNHKKSPGGSSGGEGALIAGGGSVLGFGTDVAGSIRLPSSFCGLCGLKPTNNRLRYAPKDVDSLALCMRALLCEDMFRLDPTVPPVPFNEEVYSSSAPLRIGYYDGDGYFQPSPSMRRAVWETKKLLQEAGHTLSFYYLKMLKCWLGSGTLQLDWPDCLLSPLPPSKGDIVDPNLKSQINCYRLPILVKKILALILKPVVSHLYVYPLRTLIAMGDAQASTGWEEFIAKWRQLELDVMLCPALGPAFNKAATSYTNLYNVLNFPAGVVPVTIGTEADEEELKNYRGHYGDPWDKRLREVTMGLPVAVQCVALSWQEELCLRFMKEVETLARKRKRNMGPDDDDDDDDANDLHL